MSLPVAYAFTLRLLDKEAEMTERTRFSSPASRHRASLIMAYHDWPMHDWLQGNVRGVWQGLQPLYSVGKLWTCGFHGGSRAVCLQCMMITYALQGLAWPGPKGL
jgi:hypothetical protein